MPVTSTNAYSGPFTVSGTTPVSFDFQAASADEIMVTLDGVELSADDYAVVLNGDDTGTVTPTGTWSGEVYVFSAPDFRQNADWGRFAPYFPDQLVPPLDKLTKQQITLKDRLDRAPVAPVDGSAAGRFPVAAEGGGFEFTSGVPLDTPGSVGVTEISNSEADQLAISNKLKTVQDAPGAKVRTITDKLRDTLSIRDFGARGNGSADDTQAFSDALEAVALRPDRVALILDPGEYLIDAGAALNFAKQNFQITGLGRPTLRFFGAGRAFILDAGPDGVFLEDMLVENLRIMGDGATGITDGLYARGIVRSSFRNLEVREVTGKAMHILHGVSNHYDGLRYSPSGDSVFAARGLQLSNNGLGYYTANCLFSNPVFEDFPGIGIFIEDGSGNCFQGGTTEAVNKGVVIASQCRRNTFQSLWFEGNSTLDIEDDGFQTTFEDSYMGSASSSLNAVLSGVGTHIVRGYLRAAQVESSALDVVFDGVAFDQNSGGTLGIQGTGQYRLRDCFKVDDDYNVVGAMLQPLKTWTAAFVSDGGSVTIESGVDVGHYDDADGQVLATGTFNVLSVSSPTGELYLTLPVVCAAGLGSRAAIPVMASGLVTTVENPAVEGVTVIGRIVGGEGSMWLSGRKNGTSVPLAPLVKAGTQFTIAAHYFAER